MSTDPGHQDHGRALYLWVWAGLLGLTIIEIFLSYRNLPVAVMLFVLLGLSFIKAGLIVAYFMHLKFEKRSLTLALIPATMFCIALFFIFFPDSIRLLEMGG